MTFHLEEWRVAKDQAIHPFLRVSRLSNYLLYWPIRSIVAFSQGWLSSKPGCAWTVFPNGFTFRSPKKLKTFSVFLRHYCRRHYLIWVSPGDILKVIFHYHGGWSNYAMRKTNMISSQLKWLQIWFHGTNSWKSTSHNARTM